MGKCKICRYFRLQGMALPDCLDGKLTSDALCSTLSISITQCLIVKIINSISFQKNLLQKAASAVFTYLASNPHSKVMQENLKFYSELPEVDMSQVVNLEARVRQLFQYFCYALMAAISDIVFIIKVTGITLHAIYNKTCICEICRHLNQADKHCLTPKVGQARWSCFSQTKFQKQF
jgi:hypothetical protein